VLDAYAVLLERDADRARPAAPERLDRPVIARLFRIDGRTLTDQARRHEVLQLQGTVADQNLFGRDPVLLGQLPAQRRVAALLPVLQDNTRVLANNRVQALPEFSGRERLGRWHPTGKDYSVARRHSPNPSLSVIGNAQSYLLHCNARNRGLQGKLTLCSSDRSSGPTP
jgi:hypothetical protein